MIQPTAEGSIGLNWRVISPCSVDMCILGKEKCCLAEFEEGIKFEALSLLNSLLCEKSSYFVFVSKFFPRYS